VLGEAVPGRNQAKTAGQVDALWFCAVWVNRDVSLWEWFKRRILCHPDRLSALLSANSAEELTSAAFGAEHNLLTDLPRSIVDRAIARYKDRYQSRLLRSVFDLRK
jgi:hypothetical protein